MRARTGGLLKSPLRPAKKGSREALEPAPGPALATTTAQDARGRLRLAGHAPAG